MKTRNVAMDAGRAVAALFIVGFHHLYDYCPSLTNVFPKRYDQRIAFCALAYFFFASGRLLATHGEIETKKDLTRFWTRRLLRIYPLYSIALLLLPFPVKPMLKWLSLVGLNNFLPGISGRNIPTLWFVSQILLFYALFPVFACGRSFARRPLFRLGACLFFEVLFYGGWRCFGWDQRLWWYFPTFFFGTFSASVTKPSIQQVAVILPCFFMLTMFVGPGELLFPLLLACCAVVWGLCSCVVATVHFLHPIFRAITYASFAAYLFHRPLYRVVFSYIHGEIIAIFAVPVVFAVAYIVQRSYDSCIAGIQCTK